MDVGVRAEVAALEGMTPRELRKKWREVFGEETRSGNRRYLVKRLAWRVQANAEGDISERACRRAEDLANDADLRLRAPKTARCADGEQVTGGVDSSDQRLPIPGTVLTRKYKGKTVSVTVLDDGFDYGGQVYGSLTAVAQAITGSHWNGYHFFGLRKDR